MTSFKAGKPLNQAIVELSYSVCSHMHGTRMGPSEADQVVKSVYDMEIHVWETSAGVCGKKGLMFSQLREQKRRAGVAREEEGSVGGPTHILQAAENSCRTSLC